MNGHAAKDEVPRYPGARCREWIAGLLQRCGMPPDDAALAARLLAARLLVRASLRSIDTHGVARLPAYVDQLLAGKLRASGRLRITDRRGFLVRDGDGILGQVAAHRAMDAVIAHARGAAPAACSVHNAGHTGALDCMRCRRPSRAWSPSASASRRSWHCRATARNRQQSAGVRAAGEAKAAAGVRHGGQRSRAWQGAGRAARGAYRDPRTGGPSTAPATPRTTRRRPWRGPCCRWAGTRASAWPCWSNASPAA